MKNNIVGSLTSMVLLTLLVFGILHWTDLPMSYFMDWLKGVALFWWLLLITTVPWNLHFRAKEVLSDARESENAGIEVDGKDVEYANKISRTYLSIAIFLHLVSGIGLYFLAQSGIGTIGYVGAALALMLTGLRPSVRLYEYLNYRLNRMRSRIKYPREDIQNVQTTLSSLETDVLVMKESLNLEEDHSWARKKEADIQALREDLRGIRQQFELLNTNMATQQVDLIKQTENKIALLSEDAQFLNQVRELIRFVKGA